MKKLLLVIAFASFSISASAKQTIKEGTILLNGVEQQVKISYTQNGYSSKDNVQVGDINAPIDSMSAEIEINASTKDGSKTISIYLDDRFELFQSNLEAEMQMIQPSNEDEIKCDNKAGLNALVVIFDNDEPYTTVANCLNLF